MTEKRETWGSRISFLLACIGYAVGLGNIWRFPYLCYESGGGAFLVPYFIMLVLCGIPLLLMELSMGQYTRRGPIGALGKMAPILQGAGLATVVISFWLCTYYNVIISWALYYLASSFQDPLPWVSCDNAWNTRNCSDVVSISNNTNATLSPKVDADHQVPSTQEFYDHNVLEMTSSIGDFGKIRPELMGLLFLAWVIVYFCLWKSVRATGKVVYFTATIPYVLLLAFLINGLTLEGAMKGITFFLEPKWEKMIQSKVWVYAAAQVFNSIGIAFGSLIAFSSYNKFHGPILRDTLIVVVVDAITCLLCGFCVFSAMGNLAHEQGKEVDEVITQGPGLVFVVFPHALAKMPLPQLWSVVFFGMLVLLGIDSQFATVEVIITSLKDGCGAWIDKYLKRHDILVLIVCLVAFAVGIPYVFQGGIYVFKIVDYYAAAISLMYIAFFECVAVVWIYGTGRLSANIKDMTGKGPNIFFRFCLPILSPILLLGIWGFSIYDYKEPTYGNAGEFPRWAIGAGWCIALTSLLPIPAFAFYHIYSAKADGLWNKFRVACQSTITLCPCGCETGLDDNYQAHGNSQFSLIGDCSHTSDPSGPPPYHTVKPI